MTETGRIIEVKKHLVGVRLDAGDHCFGCMNMECKRKKGVIAASNPLNLPLLTGQNVTVEVRASSLAVQGLNAAMPPVFGFIAGFFGSFLFPAFGEGLRVLCALVIMAIFGAGFYAFRAKFPAGIISKVTGITEG